MINYITYFFLISFSKFLSVIPRKIVLILGQGFGKMLYFLFPLRIKVAKINLDKIQMFIDNKKLSLNDTINMETLKKLKIISKNSQKLKILGNQKIH